MSDTLHQLEEVFRDVFQRDDLVLTRETTAQDVAGWDSMMHVMLVQAVERAFRIRFSLADVAALRNVGQFVDSIDARKK